MVKKNKILLYIVLFAVCVRLVFLLINVQRHPDFFNIDTEAVAAKLNSDNAPYLNPFGYEISNIAYAIVCSHEGYANPFGGSTGATGWVAPGIVYVYAAAFYLFDCFSKSSIFFLFVLAFCLSALMVVLVFKTSLLLFKRQDVATLSAALFALCPQDCLYILYGSQTDFNIYAFWFLMLFYLFLNMFTVGGNKSMVAFSLCAGVSLFFNPVFIFPISVCLAFFIVKNSRRLLCASRTIILSGAIMALIVGPYLLVQQSRLGRLTFVKSNAAFELYFGNSPASNGVLVYDLFLSRHPGSNAAEYLRYKHMGEVEYIASKFRQLVEEFDLRRFMRLTAQRFLAFFFIFVPYIAPERFGTFQLLVEYCGYALPGLSLLAYALSKKRILNRNDALMFCCIAAYAFPYMFAGVMYRYSAPISTITTLMLGYVLHTLLGSVAQKWPFRRLERSG